MSSDPVVSISDLGKQYRIYRRPSDRVREYLFPWRPKRHHLVWALRHISFEVFHGETVGIIGRNGSGKSTLLQILADTLTPSEGSVEVSGRVAALLELGAGFNPEFTGRENVLMNAAIMGVPRQAALDRLDEVAAFAEIGEYLDQPVRTYSSGMYVRLAFSTAIHMDPDILIVDEALAVGDIRFQRKCYRLFNDLKARGKTILFVTHAVELVRTHCDRALLLEAGRVMSVGEPRDVVHDYLNLLFSDTPEQAGAPAAPARTVGAVGPGSGAPLNLDPGTDGCPLRRTYNPTEYRWGNGDARIIDYLVRCGDVDDPVACRQGDTLEVRMAVNFKDDLKGLIYGFTVKTVDGMTVYGANTRLREIRTGDRAAGEVAVVICRLKLNLVPGDYFVSLGVALDDASFDNLALDRRYDLFHLTVEGDKHDIGVADLGLSFQEFPGAAGTERAAAS